MQMVRNAIILLILFPLVVMFFMPKKELYYLLEKQLEAQNIVISDEVLTEGPLSLRIEHPVLYFSGVPLATAKQITLWSLLFYTKADFEDLVIAEGLAGEVSVGALTAIHALPAPLKVRINGESSLGALEGHVFLRERRLYLDVPKGGQNKMLSKYLKKGEKGWYYESKF